MMHSLLESITKVFRFFADALRWILISFIIKKLRFFIKYDYVLLLSTFHNLSKMQEDQQGVELRNRYVNMMRSNSQDRNSDTRSIKATWVPFKVALRISNVALASLWLNNNLVS